MGTYQPFFSVVVRHEYFSDGLWQGLSFVPAPGTVKLLECADVVLKKTRGGIAVFHDFDKINRLRLFAQDGSGLLRFCFSVFAGDRAFEGYTSIPERKHQSTLYFSNRGVAAGGAESLSKADAVSEQDMQDWESLEAGGISRPRGTSVPDFFVDILLAPPAEGKPSAPEYRINFSARRSYLKYYLLGNMNRNNLFIVDLDNRVEFEFCGDAVLQGSRASKVFRSRAAIPIQENSGLRFQLREQGVGTGKVLIKRLPVASEGRLAMELINGKSEIISESFINF